MGEKRREKQRILSSDNRSILPVHPHAGGTQSQHAVVHAVERVGNAAGEINLDFPTRLGARQLRPKNFQSQFRLPQRCSETSRGTERSWPGGIAGEVGIVDSSRDC